MVLESLNGNEKDKVDKNFGTTLISSGGIGE